MIDPKSITWNDCKAVCANHETLESYLVQVRMAMQKQNVSGAQLARWMGKSPSFVNRMLAHHFGDVTLHFIREVAEHLNVVPEGATPKHYELEEWQVV